MCASKTKNPSRFPGYLSLASLIHSFVPGCDGPALEVILDGQPETVDFPEGIQGPGSARRLAVSGAHASFLCVVLRSPDTRGQVPALFIWSPKPVPGASVSLVHLASAGQR